MYVLQHASFMEVLQFLAALIGFGLAMWALWSTFTIAVELTGSAPDDLRRLVALNEMRGHFARMSAQGVLVFIGVVSILLPPPTGGENLDPELTQAALIRVGLVIVTAILTLDAIMERRQEISFTGRARANKLAHGGQVVTTIGGKEVARGELPTVQAVVPPD